MYTLSPVNKQTKLRTKMRLYNDPKLTKRLGDERGTGGSESSSEDDELMGIRVGDKGGRGS